MASSDAICSHEELICTDALLIPSVENPRLRTFFSTEKLKNYNNPSDFKSTSDKSLLNKSRTDLGRILKSGCRAGVGISNELSHRLPCYASN